MTESLALSTLIVDFALYPRNTIEEVHVSDLLRALQSGATLPPIIVEGKSKRIVDGVHRHRALLKHLGTDAVAEVELRDYADDAALFLEAARLNAAHGRKLDRADQTRIVIKLQELHVDERLIAATLHIPEPDVRTLAVRIVYDETGSAVPQKRGLEHLRGQTLTDAQIGAMKSVRSAESGRLCLELIRLVENDLVDYADELTYKRFQELARIVTLCLKRMRQVRIPKKVSA